MHILDNIEKRKLSIESQVEVLQHTIRHHPELHQFRLEFTNMPENAN